MIQHTATRIASSSQSSQLEVFLKVKQASNVDFSFLNPSNELHQYYLFLKGKCCSTSIKCIDSNSDHGNNRDDGSDHSNNVNKVKSDIVGLLCCYLSSDEDIDAKSSDGSKKDDNNAVIEEFEVDEEKNKCIITENSAHVSDSAHGCGRKDDSLMEQKRKAERLERVRRWKESRLK